MQERRLSPRLVHYARDQLFWECKSALLSECGRNDWRANAHDQDDIVEDRRMRSRRYPLNAGARDPIIRWQVLVSAYSTLQFTNSSDLLPALAGIVQRERVSRTDDVYIVGMWRESLVKDLGFYTSNRVLSTSTAPSWSWTYLQGPVEFEKIQEPFVTKLVSISFDRIGHANIGQVVNASIKLKGPVISTAARHVSRGIHQSTMRIPSDDMIFEVYVTAIGALDFLHMQKKDTTTSIIILSCTDWAGMCVGNYLEKMSSGRYRRLGAVLLQPVVITDPHEDELSDCFTRKQFMKSFIAALPVEEMEII
jgi:hypothetical protein